MPKTSSFYSIVREIRQMIGFTQSQLAAVLGVNFNTIRRIETGSMKLSVPMAQRLAGISGIGFRDLFENRQLDPEQIRSAYTAKGQEDRLKFGNQIIQETTGKVTWLVELVQENAPEKLGPLEAAISTALDNLVSQFGLVDAALQWLVDTIPDPQERLAKKAALLWAVAPERLSGLRVKPLPPQKR
jgi:transcriptional regulator with XRE-family HTH domain